MADHDCSYAAWPLTALLHIYPAPRYLLTVNFATLWLFLERKWKNLLDEFTTNPSRMWDIPKSNIPNLVNFIFLTIPHRKYCRKVFKPNYGLDPSHIKILIQLLIAGTHRPWLISFARQIVHQTPSSRCSEGILFTEVAFQVFTEVAF